MNMSKNNIKPENSLDLTPDERCLCSALVMVSRPLYLGSACELYVHLSKKGLFEEKITPAIASAKINSLVKSGHLVLVVDQLMVVRELLLDAFIYPLWYGFCNQLLREVDSFIAGNISERRGYYSFHYYDSHLGREANNLYSGKVIFGYKDYSLLNYLANMAIEEGILCAAFTSAWFPNLPEATQIKSFVDYYQHFLFSFDHNVKSNFAAIEYFLDENWLEFSLFKQHAAHYIAEYLILRGDFARAEVYLQASTSPERHGLSALLSYIRNGGDTAVSDFKAAFKTYKKENGRRNLVFQTLADAFYLLALLQHNSPQSLSEAQVTLGKLDNIDVRFRQFYAAIYELCQMKLTGKCQTTYVLSHLSSSHAIINKWLTCFVLHWLGASIENELAVPMQKCIKATMENGLDWLAAEGLAMLEHSGQKLDKQLGSFLETHRHLIKLPLVERCKSKESWEALLDAVQLTITPTVSAARGSASRLIWVVNNQVASFNVMPYEQKKLKNGKWSKAKEIFRFGNVYNKKQVPEFCSDHDRKAIDALATFDNYNRESSEIYGRALLQLIGHDNVFFANMVTRVELVSEEPELVLTGSGDKLILKWVPDYSGYRFCLVERSDKKLAVVEFTPYHQKLADLLNSGTKFPLSAGSRLHEMLSSLRGKIKVRTELASVGKACDFTEVPVDYATHAQLGPVKDGLRVSLRVAPLPEATADFVPGRGLREAIVDGDGKKFLVNRDFTHELALVEAIIEKCPSLRGLDSSDFSAEYPDPGDALQLLLELQQVSGLTLDWPKNYKPKRVSVAKFSDFKFRIKGDSDWFSLQGELKINEETVLNLQLLLQKYDGKSRFFSLDEERVLAITDDFRRRLNDLASCTLHKKNDCRFVRGAVPAFDGLLADAGSIEVDESWKNAVEKFRAVAEMSFALPAAFTAELREYQHEGFIWLSRLAAMGMGACLADDMGLGKTIEALAIVLSRAEIGPTLVIAPTSVCINWFNEVRKFAPILKPVILSQVDRGAALDALAPFDLVICSYGIMNNEIGRLEKITWQTLVLDEAQLIKNMNTGRSQAAMRLKGHFKMLLTGTPIENHLGELWNLFNFINPGLLGNIEDFNRNFTVPIQVQGDKQAQNRLKRLVQPFILRRTKSQVLLDLPEKTEITLHVDLNSEETALYESIRRDSLEKIAGCESTARPMQILAEITRLRRVCCNPALVAPDAQISSSKMELLEKLIDELQENQHKALIFSQFVDHLALVRQMLERKKIPYRYLDGSTPQKVRAEEVDSFQKGTDSFFLISLKAGGLGLNLTAADYVIHLDPWWNPAVEDQASDRAYRIGQTRPVTVYRLITTNTIEEKIVALHGRKRELADGLLAGSDMAARISAKELLELISAI